MVTLSDSTLHQLEKRRVLFGHVVADIQTFECHCLKVDPQGLCSIRGPRLGFDRGKGI
jgi:hypothetical protein